MSRMPALSLAAIPGRRSWTVALAKEIEERGFAGIYCPSLGDCVALCEAIALSTKQIPFGTSVAPIYTRHVADFAANVSFIHEVSEGRFRFGIGVSHGPMHERLGIAPGKPLSDMRAFVEDIKNVPRVGELPPIVLATLRDRMTGLASEIADGAVWANGSRSHMAHSLGLFGDEQRAGDDFLIGDMIPTCIHQDEAKAAAKNRRTLSGYVTLPNYRNYWKAAGYIEEMEAVERAIEAGEPERIPQCLSDDWLADCTLFGPVDKVREGVEAWFESGIKTPILVPSSADGNQMKAFEEIFATFE